MSKSDAGNKPACHVTRLPLSNILPLSKDENNVNSSSDFFLTVKDFFKFHFWTLCPEVPPVPLAVYRANLKTARGFFMLFMIQKKLWPIVTINLEKTSVPLYMYGTQKKKGGIYAGRERENTRHKQKGGW